MKSFFSFLFLLTVCGPAFSQTPADTLYIDEVGRKTSKENAFFYRIVKPQGSQLLVTDYYLDGTLQMKGTYNSMNPDVKDGDFTYYTEKGTLQTECSYKNNKLHGEYRSYRTREDMGTVTVWLWRVKNYDTDLLDGSYITYDQQKRIRREDMYKADKRTSGKCFDENGAEIAYFPAEEMPEFPGGQSGLARFLMANIIYPEYAKQHNIEGKVYLSFVIDEMGKVNSIKVIRGVHLTIDNEAVRVLKRMPLWKPGTEEGSPVKVSYRLPIDFKLQ